MAYWDYPNYYGGYDYYSPYGTYEGPYQEWRHRISSGEPVVGLWGDSIGTVKDIFSFGFLVDRPFAGDITIPFDAILDTDQGRIQLNIPADQVGTAYAFYNRGNYNYGYRSQPGPYTGRGPRNFRRTDDQIRDDINDRLWMDGQLDASDIDVSVDNGVVTLDGFVDSRWAKRRADDLAWMVPGVYDVLNNLKVARGTWENWRPEMHSGMDVMGSLGGKVGTIGEIRDFDFLVNRSGESGLWVPFSAIQDVINDRVILNLTKDDIKNRNWQTTETMPA